MSRCTVRLRRGRGLHRVCNVGRHRFTALFGGTNGVGRNGRNIGFVVLLRRHLSGMICHLNLTSAHHRTHRLIGRNRMAISNGHISVPSCRITINRMVNLHRGSGGLMIIGTTTRTLFKHPSFVAFSRRGLRNSLGHLPIHRRLPTRVSRSFMMRCCGGLNW